MNLSFQEIENEAKQKLSSAKSAEELEAVRISFLGKKGKITGLLEQLKALEGDEKKQFGMEVNRLKQWFQEHLDTQKKQFGTLKTSPKEILDQTLPGIRPQIGRVHPITQTIQEISRIFEQLGFETVTGPELETEFHNFTALNIPLDHPARDAFDTFYSPSGHLLRSQTSTVQIRIMQERKPPLRIIAPGRVYRPDEVDASHSFMFHQIEGLMVDEDITFSHLKGILHLVLRQLFGSDIKIRFRPHFFPFTEPSVEVDIKWGKGWLEILGAGCVHPNVFQAVNYDAKRLQGFAFGMGVERMAMLRHQIPDIRYFYENDFRFLEQF